MVFISFQDIQLMLVGFIGVLVSFYPTVTKAFFRRFPVKKTFLTILQISEESIYAGVSMITKFESYRLQLQKMFSWEICKIFNNSCITEVDTSREEHPPEVFFTKGTIKNSQNSQKNTCARDSFLINCRPRLQLCLKRDSGTVVSFEFCEIFKNILFTEHPPRNCIC